MRALAPLLADPASQAATLGALQHIDGVFAAFFASMTAGEATEEGQRRRLLIALASTPKDIAENVQLRARDWFQELELPYLPARVEFPGPPYRLAVTPAIVARPPSLGEHTTEVLACLK
jgi:crotonobetainyl-CoA:carnitine CoA-transferase CaiB-like acyl-CoA transferase